MKSIRPFTPQHYSPPYELTVTHRHQPCFWNADHLSQCRRWIALTVSEKRRSLIFPPTIYKVWNGKWCVDIFVTFSFCVMERLAGLETNEHTRGLRQACRRAQKQKTRVALWSLMDWSRNKTMTLTRFSMESIAHFFFEFWLMAQFFRSLQLRTTSY